MNPGALASNPGSVGPPGEDGVGIFPGLLVNVGITPAAATLAKFILSLLSSFLASNCWAALLKRLSKGENSPPLEEILKLEEEVMVWVVAVVVGWLGIMGNG
ncbi:MAG: hypothetical protein AB2693_32395 [Candidatus Thiodiazotropha sp.]